MKREQLLFHIYTVIYVDSFEGTVAESLLQYLRDPLTPHHDGLMEIGLIIMRTE